jgi:hypothetical protein
MESTMSSKPEDPKEPDVKRDDSGRFAKRHKKLGGRKLGTPNRSTVVLEALFYGLGETPAARRAFVRQIAEKDPRTAARLLCRILPKIVMPRDFYKTGEFELESR